METVHKAKQVNYTEAYNLEIGLPLNFGSTRLELHRFTDKKYNSGLVQHPYIPVHPKNHSSDK